MDKKPCSCALLISTYNWPDALACVLESVKMQTRLPNEVIIADDGSREETRELIQNYQRAFPCPIKHVWHPDDGFKKCVILNKALLQADAEYIVQADGDCVLEKHFVEDHLRYAEAGTFLCGSRILLSPNATQKVLQERRIPKVFSPGVRNRSNAFRIPFLTKFLAARYRKNKPYFSRGCNMSYWKDDIVKVNGYNEDITGWGKEDAELEIRLMNLGVKRRALKFAAVQYHLFHKEYDRSREQRNIEILRSTIDSKVIKASNGIRKREA